MAQEHDVKPSVLERHMQTGIQVLLVAQIILAGSELGKLGQQSVVPDELRHELKSWDDTCYRATEACFGAMPPNETAGTS